MKLPNYNLLRYEYSLIETRIDEYNFFVDLLYKYLTTDQEEEIVTWFLNMPYGKLSQIGLYHEQINNQQDAIYLSSTDDCIMVKKTVYNSRTRKYDIEYICPCNP